MSREARVERATSETSVRVAMNLDGTGAARIATGIGFFDHLLDQLARHSLIDLEVEATGDVEPFQVGDRAKIIDGPLAGVTGVLTGQDKNQRFNILLEGIQQVIQVQLPASLLKRVDA